LLFSCGVTSTGNISILPSDFDCHVSCRFVIKTFITFYHFIAATGYATGECYRNLKTHPGTVKTIIGYSIGGGKVHIRTHPDTGHYGTKLFMISHSVAVSGCVMEHLKIEGNFENKKT